MAGLLSWAADVVGGVGVGEWSDGENDPSAVPLILNPEQMTYVQELDRKAAFLKRSIQDLRLKLPPSDMSHNFPDLHAHSLASNNDLALQLDAHSATKQEAQLREDRLQEENVEYQIAISNCERKIHMKLQEVELLQIKLKEMDLIDDNLESEWLRAKGSVITSEVEESGKMLAEAESASEAHEGAEASKSALMQKLENKKKEMALMEEIVQDLERKLQQVHEHTLKQPTPAQREKALDKQLHSLIEQLAAKQAQAEGLISEIRLKELELEKLNGMWRRIDSSSLDSITARNRFARSSTFKEPASDTLHSLPVHMASRSESLERERKIIPWRDYDCVEDKSHMHRSTFFFHAAIILEQFLNRMDERCSPLNLPLMDRRSIRHGGLIRDHQGGCLAAFSKFLGLGINNAAELRVAIEGLRVCKSKGWNNVILETDSMILVGRILKNHIVVFVRLLGGI